LHFDEIDGEGFEIEFMWFTTFIILKTISIYVTMIIYNVDSQYGILSNEKSSGIFMGVFFYNMLWKLQF
jgi:hypothetical protein